MPQKSLYISPQKGFAARFFSPVNLLPLVWMRILFGIVILWEVKTFFQNDWIFNLLQEPKIHFTYPGFDWIAPLQGKGMDLVFYLLGLAAICVILGLLYRLAIAVTTVLFTYIFLIDVSYYLNHYYLFILIGFLMCFVQANGKYSLDARIWPERFRRDKVPAWQLYLLLGQIGIAYFFGGIAKISSPDWMLGQPAGLWLAAHTDFPLVGAYLGERWMAITIAWIGTVLDLLIFPALLWRKTRVAAILFGVIFHLINSFWFNIGGFPWFMMGAMVAFIPADQLQHWLDKLAGKKNQQTKSKLPSNTSNPIFQKLALAGFILWFSIQIILPLRHFLIPGDVTWTYEGHRFSWRMKLVDRQSEGISFRAINLDNQEVTAVNHKLYLNPRQYAKLGTQTGMMIQFSEFMQLELRKRGYPNIAVYASSNVSLNGRPAVPFIDTKKNLLDKANQLTPSPLILPPPTSALPAFNSKR